jgi:hypothetical protein
MPLSAKQRAPFLQIEKLQGTAPFGQMLDAGTGPASIEWLLSLETETWTAVTAAPGNAKQVERLVGNRKRAGDRILRGNWANPSLLEGERFDTVLADHLVGAVDGFSPFQQMALIRRLRALTGGRFYLVGMEPYLVKRPESEAGQLLFDIGRFRDACLLLTGGQPFREYPLAWVVTELEQAGFKITATQRFPMRLSATFVTGQVDRTMQQLADFKDRALGDALEDHGFALRDRALAYVKQHGALAHGFNYLVAAEPV